MIRAARSGQDLQARVSGSQGMSGQQPAVTVHHDGSPADESRAQDTERGLIGNSRNRRYRVGVPELCCYAWPAAGGARNPAAARGEHDSPSKCKAFENPATFAPAPQTTEAVASLRSRRPVGSHGTPRPRFSRNLRANAPITQRTMRLHFERGTVVMATDAPEPALKSLEGARWDPRIGHYRAPAFRYRALVAALRTLGIPFHDDVRTRRVQTGPWQPVQLRPYQHAALLAWDRDKRGLIVLPTGSGKTRLACAAMARCRVPTLCLVPTRALLHQWRGEIARHYAAAIGCMGGGHTVEDITVATFESAYRQMDRIGHRFGLLVVDEVHHFGTGARDEALEMCAAPRRLALTATAPTGDALDRVIEVMGPLVCELSIGDLVGEWLADFDDMVLALRLTPDEQRRYDAATRAFREVFERFQAFQKDARWSDFVATASRSEHGRAALAAFFAVVVASRAIPKPSSARWARCSNSIVGVASWCSPQTTRPHTTSRASISSCP